MIAVAKQPTKKSKGKKPKRVVAPPSANRPVIPKVKVFSESKTARVLEPPRGSSRDADRTAAASSFIFDVHQRTIDWWHTNEYPHIPDGTFRKWASQDQWYDRRQRFLESVEKTVAAKIATQVVKERVQELGDLASVRRASLQFLGGKDEKGQPIAIAPPKTFGEAVAAFVKVDERIDEKRAAILDDLPLALGSSTPDTSTTDAAGSTGVPASLPFDEAQVRAMAHAAMRARLPPHVEVEDPKGDGASDDDEGDSDE